MKKLFGIVALFSIVVLAGCGNSNTVTDEVVTDEPLAVVADTDVVETTDTKSTKDYQLSFTMEMNTPEDGDMFMDISVHKKWADVAYIFNKMESDDAEMLQFVPTQIIVMGDTSYTQLNQDGELMRLEAPSGEDQFVWGMFDFDNMEEAMEAEMDSKETEKIDGKKMICYYKKDATEDSKACIYEGIMHLMESTELADWATTTMKVYEYNKKVDKSLFTVPKETISIEEMMAKMMQNM